MKREPKQLDCGPFDLLVIGGGIYGAWTAYDAVLRGLKVAIVDKGDWASGTSCASSKLVHGGLRYLETFQFRLVRKSLAERQLLAELAPHRIQNLQFLIPTYTWNRIGPLRLKAGLWIYDRLAGRNQRFPFHKSLARKDIVNRYPMIKQEGLRDGFLFSDCQTDDFRLTLEILDGAYKKGATLVNYTEVKRFVIKNEEICAVGLLDHLTNQSLEIEAKAIVNTAGPWVSELSRLADKEVPLRLTKGIHLLLPPLNGNDALLLTAKRDGRVYFVIPWYGKTLIGTTDTDYHGNLDQLEVMAEEIEYLLSEVNTVFPDQGWNVSSILGSYAGLRALNPTSNGSPSSVSREWSIHEPLTNLIVSSGGKLTSARSDARLIVDRAMDILGKPNLGNYPTDTRPFPWCPEEDFSIWQNETRRECGQIGMDEETAIHCCLRHGTNIEQILNIIRSNSGLKARISPGVPFCLAEVIHSVKAEMAIHLYDILRRRAPVVLLTKANPEIAEIIATLVAPILNWSENQRKNEINDLLRRWSSLCA